MISNLFKQFSKDWKDEKIVLHKQMEDNKQWNEEFRLKKQFNNPRLCL
jgi:hypothetical protein